MRNFVCWLDLFWLGWVFSNDFAHSHHPRTEDAPVLRKSPTGFGYTPTPHHSGCSRSALRGFDQGLRLLPAHTKHIVLFSPHQHALHPPIAFISLIVIKYQQRKNIWEWNARSGSNLWFVKSGECGRFVWSDLSICIFYNF